MFQVKAKLIKNIEVRPKYCKIVLYCPRISKAAKPGQFVQIRVNNDLEPLLRRPLGIHRADGSNIEVLFEVVGKGTQVLSQRKAGEYLDIIGPLGNGFSIHNTQYTILIAGGVGLAPLVFLAERLTKARTLVLIGARTKREILCEKELKDLGCQVKVSTDDGSKGFKGKITELLRKVVRPLAIDHRPSTIYACGPRPMLKEIARLSKVYRIPAQVSLEEHMACGIGACLGCVVKTKTEHREPNTEYKRVCKEGPVFEIDELIW